MGPSRRNPAVASRSDDAPWPSRARAIATALVLSLVVAIGIVPAAAPAPVMAATPGLTLVGEATYDVRPDEHRVAVTVRLTATNHLKNTATKRYFFRTALLTVLPGTSGFKLTGSSGKPRVSVASKKADYTNLKLDFGANLAAGRATTLTLAFDLKDPGGAPDRAIRISSSLVSFAAWAYATPDTPGASVRVQLPSGYSVTVGRGPMTGPTPDGGGRDVFSSGALAKPLAFVADIAADRAADVVETSHQVPMQAGAATVLLRAWPDDPGWRDRVQGLVERALPVLEREIGVPWPLEGPLAIQEALVRSTGGYAGIYAPSDRRIDIAYAASDAIVLHELAHAWFNGGLVADRWEAEAFAGYYAEKAGAELGIEAPPAAVEDDPELAIPLNAWGPSEATDPAVEAWAYQASLGLAEAIANRAGAPALQEVWQQASRGIGAYQPPSSGAAKATSAPTTPTARSTAAAPSSAAAQPTAADAPAAPATAAARAGEEPAPGPPDWRGLLDLLEASSGKDFSDLWRTSVVRPDDLPALADRAATRGWYRRSLELAGDWQLPASIRSAMRTWQFEAAREQLAGADAVHAQVLALEAAAAAAKVELPGRVRTAFEGDGGTAAATAEANAELTIVNAIAAAEAARPSASAGALEQAIIRIGLLKATPDEDLAAARAAFAAGEIEEAYGAANAAEAAWAGAFEVGRGRVVSGALLVAALLLLIGLVRQRRRRVAAPVQAAEPAAPGAP